MCLVNLILELTDHIFWIQVFYIDDFTHLNISNEQILLLICKDSIILYIWMLFIKK